MPNSSELNDWPFGKEHYVRIRVMWSDPKWQGCERKTKFGSAEDALTLLPHMRVYKCRHCDGWHLTTPKSPS